MILIIFKNNKNQNEKKINISFKIQIMFILISLLWFTLKYVPFVTLPDYLLFILNLFSLYRFKIISPFYFEMLRIPYFFIVFKLMLKSDFHLPKFLTIPLNSCLNPLKRVGLPLKNFILLKDSSLALIYSLCFSFFLSYKSNMGWIANLTG